MALFYRELGSGDPIVLLHPGPGLDGTVFLPGVERLPNRVILPDLPGSGQSTEGDWTLRGQAAAIQAFVEELGLTDWTLLGHSFGGYVAAQHLVDHGTAARYILSGTDVDEEPAIEDDPLAHVPDSVREAFEAESTVRTPEECRAVWLAQMPVFSNTDISHMLADVTFRPEAHHEHELGELHALDALAAADVPVLSIGGADDRWYPPPFAQRIADTAKHGELLIVPGGHFPFAEDPASYWDGVADWLSRVR
jgi:pimeloyl-ACP methyl ester carboxylesterase